MKTLKQDDHLKEGIRIVLIEQSIMHIYETLKRLEKTLDSIDERFNRIETSLRRNFIWMIGGFASILLIMAHSFHWI